MIAYRQNINVIHIYVLTTCQVCLYTLYHVTKIKTTGESKILLYLAYVV